MSGATDPQTLFRHYAIVYMSLKDPVSFVNACRELIEWCSDVRAFQRSFEENLITTLRVVVTLAVTEGYDQLLGARLIACCHRSRDRLNAANAGE
uniref:Zmiz1 N-terminal tetratricopeptide repeat domain-containing protein n=1 Tax=Plectus sambesii TaxID=2011161 RepID=A0A914URS3_9BILA